MKKMFYLAALAVLAIAIPALAAERPAEPTEPNIMNLTSMPVVFNHSSHADYECETCHHPVDGTPTYLPCAASGCHDNLDRKAKGVDSYYQTMHKVKDTKFPTCISCHREFAGDDRDLRRTLTGCTNSACHPKKEG